MTTAWTRDGDGRIDFRADGSGDTDCTSPADTTEDTPAPPGGGVPPQCDDGIDNDGDGAIDFTGIPGEAEPDPDCTGSSDASEAA